MRHSTYPERRKTQRRPIFLEGTISYAGRCRAKYLVQNLSESGAKLAFHTITDVPAEFTLNFFLTGEAARFLAQPRWRRRRFIGVKFLRRDPENNAVSLQDYIQTCVI
jgi:PilZ domain